MTDSLAIKALLSQRKAAEEKMVHHSRQLQEKQSVVDMHKRVIKEATDTMDDIDKAVEALRYEGRVES